MGRPKNEIIHKTIRFRREDYDRIRSYGQRENRQFNNTIDTLCKHALAVLEITPEYEPLLSAAIKLLQVARERVGYPGQLVKAVEDLEFQVKLANARILEWKAMN